MCDCDCELPKRERWKQIREEALEGLVTVASKGRFVVHDGKVHRIKDMWVELRASDRERWGVVIWKEGS
ncbi:hypothetical protein [Streptomyces formicae]|uniref:Uncharacterized protein n=1 Tax=Streptomyces formicae TaxID=1616117 RepID=A0ABY3WR72_9ACTN|nr:hypothetical protein [Streptomyces formicae]UNM12308.1 hypothetical protein J4032_12885 [Streptomyces formicae]